MKFVFIFAASRFPIQAEGSLLERKKISDVALSSAASLIQVNRAEREFLNDECVICVETITQACQVAVTDCKHGYHPLCLKQWLALKNNCPVCQKEKPFVSYPNGLDFTVTKITNQEQLTVLYNLESEVEELAADDPCKATEILSISEAWLKLGKHLELPERGTPAVHHDQNSNRFEVWNYADEAEGTISGFRVMKKNHFPVPYLAGNIFSSGAYLNAINRFGFPMTDMSAILVEAYKLIKREQEKEGNHFSIRTFSFVQGYYGFGTLAEMCAAYLLAFFEAIPGRALQLEISPDQSTFYGINSAVEAGEFCERLENINVHRRFFGHWTISEVSL